MRQALAVQASQGNQLCCSRSLQYGNQALWHSHTAEAYRGIVAGQGSIVPVLRRVRQEDCQ